MLRGITWGWLWSFFQKPGSVWRIPLIRWRFWGCKPMSNWKYFSDDEVLQWQLVPELWSKLDMARAAAGVPVIITSGRRTPDKNSVLKGAVPDSSHLTGQGVDIWVEDDHAYYCLLRGLFAAGFKRIGHYFTLEPDRLIPRHLHIDIDETKPQECCFAKKEEN